MDGPGHGRVQPSPGQSNGSLNPDQNRNVPTTVTSYTPAHHAPVLREAANQGAGDAVLS
jgi:hypothetical protein